MTDEESMISAVMARPWVPVTRGAYADWLDENGRSAEANLARTNLKAVWPRSGSVDVHFSFRGETPDEFPDIGTEAFGVVGYEWRWDGPKGSSWCVVVAAARAMVLAVDYDVMADKTPVAGIRLLADTHDCFRYDVAYVVKEARSGKAGGDLLEVKFWKDWKFEPIEIR